ncbi:MAG: hypothetical protein GY870_10435 [archaeon]|nr:hypothetical protein [archaeon]
MKNDNVFFEIFRKGGFNETLKCLSEYGKKGTKQSDFYQKLLDNGTYLNSFFRSKEDLTKYKLISYTLDPENEKVIFLTDKGFNLFNRINEIEDMINNKE